MLVPQSSDDLDTDTEFEPVEDMTLETRSRCKDFFFLNLFVRWLMVSTNLNLSVKTHVTMGMIAEQSYLFSVRIQKKNFSFSCTNYHCVITTIVFTQDLEKSVDKLRNFCFASSINCVTPCALKSIKT